MKIENFPAEYWWGYPSDHVLQASARLIARHSATHTRAARRRLGRWTVRGWASLSSTVQLTFKSGENKSFFLCFCERDRKPLTSQDFRCRPPQEHGKNASKASKATSFGVANNCAPSLGGALVHLFTRSLIHSFTDHRPFVTLPLPPLAVLHSPESSQLLLAERCRSGPLPSGSCPCPASSK